MKLIAGEIRPGVVVEVCDNVGTIRAAVPGYFSFEDDPSLLPPIFPFLKMSPTQFAKPAVGDNVWVLTFSDNPQELFYFFQGDVRNTAMDVLEGDHQDVEILLKHKSGTSWAQLFFSDGTGWILQNDGSRIEISPSGTINIVASGDHAAISVGSHGVALGVENSRATEPAVLGNQLMKCLKGLADGLQEVAKAANANPYTIGLAPPLFSAFGKFESAIGDICSDYVTLE